MSGPPPEVESAPPPNPQSTALLDALIARGLASNPAAVAKATPLEGYPQLPNPDPNSAPPLYGEPPGEGYLYAHDPEFRQAALVSTSPDVVRMMLLRSIEVLSQNAMLPFNEEGAAKLGDSILRMAQAYLLLDPTVDAQGVPVAGQATAKAAAQLAVEHGKPQPSAPAGKPGEAHGTVKPGKQVGGDKLPPKVLPGTPAQLLSQMHENAETMLRGARGSRPLPQPRIGA